jgi:hypothetical protein
MFENRVLRGGFGLEREAVIRDWKNSTMSCAIICTLPRMILMRMRWVGDTICVGDM